MGIEPVAINPETGEPITTPQRPVTKGSSPDRKVLRLSPSRLKEISGAITLPELPRGNADSSKFKKRESDDLPANEKERIIVEMRETIHTLGLKVGKLETLLALKDRKIEELVGILRSNNLL